jgi:hypothetical protein
VQTRPQGVSAILSNSVLQRGDGQLDYGVAVEEVWRQVGLIRWELPAQDPGCEV